MPNALEWKKKAEAEYENEKEDVGADVKAGLSLHLLIYIVIGVVLGAIYVVRWMVVGGDFLPSNHDSVWMTAIVIGVIPFTYLMDRHDRVKKVREQRLIRLEMKLDELLDRLK